MPLPGSSDLEPETADIDNCFEPFRDEEVTDKAISTGLLDNAVHPAVAKARHQQQSNPDALLRGGEDATAGNVTQARLRTDFDAERMTALRWGRGMNATTGVPWGMQAPLVSDKCAP